MKKTNILTLSLFVVTLGFILACSEDTMFVPNEDQISKNLVALTIPDSVKVNVNDGRLEFAGEKELQTCINYLSEIGDSQLDAFEAYLGYTSYRSSTEEMHEKVADNVFATLINQDRKIIIQNFEFTTNFDNETTTVSKVDVGLKSVGSSDENTITLTWDDDVFEMMEQTPATKGWWPFGSSCSHCNNTDEKHTFETRMNSFHAKGQAKVCFQRFTWYNSVIIKFKLQELTNGGPRHPYVHLQAEILYGSYIKPHKTGSIYVSWKSGKFAVGKGSEISSRPYQRSTRVDDARIAASFTWTIYNTMNTYDIIFYKENKLLIMKCS